jgi:hypothetical protein
VTAWEAAPEIIEAVPVPCAHSELGDDAQRERVAANTGEVLTEQVGGSSVIACSRRADHFDVMTFPAHLTTVDYAQGRCGQGVKVGDREPERPIFRERVTERLYRLGRVSGLLRLAIEGGGLGIRRDRPTVVLDRGTSSGGGLGTARVRPFQVAIHVSQVALAT